MACETAAFTSCVAASMSRSGEKVRLTFVEPSELLDVISSMPAMAEHEERRHDRAANEEPRDAHCPRAGPRARFVATVLQGHPPVAPPRAAELPPTPPAPPAPPRWPRLAVIAPASDALRNAATAPGVSRDWPSVTTRSPSASPAAITARPL